MHVSYLSSQLKEKFFYFLSCLADPPLPPPSMLKPHYTESQERKVSLLRVMSPETQSKYPSASFAGIDSFCPHLSQSSCPDPFSRSRSATRMVAHPETRFDAY
ncbi:uncharacterized protein BO95DRAFT_276263 [Aspergillus brunneoviolaceus CBS 621.78]|uniref:Uncharacterized protein n=1 Tax=Aspergillus brunneoviolaceus CBS 621.78 TaxID=1450534 RepID=A0ACD1FVV2_9EURO|nr:hypothetical protein BO95DRAFT_276263 [Aspergillus brunneoviolaceus CBS 621.78]RAH41135.1 hypothetical protein BO95DRAFT_276263 [Aspergillus brunneoviolaceus CBS 621.78]